MESQRFYDQAYTWILFYAPRALLGVIILLIGLWLIRATSGWLKRHMHKRELDPSLKPFFLSLIIIALRVLLFLSVLQIVGVEMTIFASIIAAFGIATGLALSGTLQNFASGVLILILKPFKVGDNIVTQGSEGTVTDIQLFYTNIKTFDNKSVIVPNSKLSNEVIINLSREGTRRLDIELKFNYGYDIEQIKGIINKSVDAESNILKTPERRIGVSSIDADGFKIMVNVWLNAHGFYDAKLLFQERLIQRLKQSGLKLPGM